MSEEVSVQAMDELMAKMVALDLEIKEKEAAVSELNKQLMQMKADATEKLKALGRDSYKSDHGSFSIVQQWRFTLPQTLEEKEKAFNHLKTVGGKDLLYQYATINSNSYSAFCNAEWEEAKQRGEGMEYKSPHGTEAKLFESVRLTKSRKP